MSELTKPVVSGPKPFVFVLMPFDRKFNDIYEYGIKGAAADAGAYAERVDEQIHTGSIYDRIVNQIAKADIIVADMTGKNPNVYYEVGYAHALGKRVFLLTQDASDIPFDLKHQPHIVYGGEIRTLREKLAKSLAWSVENVDQLSKPRIACPFEFWLNEVRFAEGLDSYRHCVDMRTASGRCYLTVRIRNGWYNGNLNIDAVYLLMSRKCGLTPRSGTTAERAVMIHEGDDEWACGFGPRFLLATRISLVPGEFYTNDVVLTKKPVPEDQFPFRVEALAAGTAFRFNFVNDPETF